MPISGGMRTRPSLVGLLTGPRAPTPPIAQGPTIRFFGLLLTLAGGVAIVLGAGLAADGLPRLALEFP